MQKVDNPQVEIQVVELLKNTPMAVSIDFVAHNLRIHWTTARGLLLNMALKGKIKAVKTTKSFIFTLPQGAKE